MPNAMEELASMGAGKAGAVSAKLKGLHGVFVKLAEEHREAATLLKRAIASDDSAKRADVWSKLRCELLSHEKAELEAVYPNLDDADPIASQHAKEARTLEALIADVDAQPHDSESWRQNLERLQSAVQAHVELEEEQLFPRMQDALGKDAAKDIEQRYLRCKKSEMKALA